jgi:hypothetical protein
MEKFAEIKDLVKASQQLASGDGKQLSSGTNGTGPAMPQNIISASDVKTEVSATISHSLCSL